MIRCPRCDYFQAESNALKDRIMKLVEMAGQTVKHEFTAEVGDKILFDKYEKSQAENQRLRAALERCRTWVCSCNDADCLRRKIIAEELEGKR